MSMILGISVITAGVMGITIIIISINIIPIVVAILVYSKNIHLIKRILDYKLSPIKVGWLTK